MIELREYQTNAVANILADWRDGFRRVLLMAATGTGKTIMFLSLLDKVIVDGKRALILAHRRELIFQPIDKAQKFYPDLANRMGIVMADRNDYKAQVVVATVQSLRKERLDKILEAGAIDYVIIDESHHVVASQYVKILEALGDPMVLGCTATPKRTDRIALGKVFKKVSYKISIQDAIREGALVPFTPLGFALPVDASKVKETKDGWEDDPMGELLSAENIMEIVLEKWREFAGSRQTIAFTASVAQAHNTAAFFRERGIAAQAIDGTTNDADRDRILGDFQSGKVQIVMNCMVLTEGFDAPETSCVMMIAPPKSDLIYVQRLGRGLRTAIGKEDCIVLDFAPKGARNIIMAGDVLGGIKDEVVKKAKEAIERGEVSLFGFRFDQFGMHAIDPNDVQTMVLDYMGKSRLAWNFDGVYLSAPLSKDAALVIVSPDRTRLEKADELRRSGSWSEDKARLAEHIESFRLYQVDRVEAFGKFHWEPRQERTFQNLQKAKAAAEEITRSYPDDLNGKTNFWRSKPMSEAQSNYLRSLGAWQPGLTSGQAAQRITHVVTVRAAKVLERKLETEVLRGH